MEEKQPTFKILMFPWLGHGHVSPFLELAKKLSKRNFHIYFYSTSVILDTIKNISTEYFLIDFVQLKLPSLPNLPPHHHTPKNIPPNLLGTLREAFQMSSSSFSNILIDINPDLLIYDIFQPWAAKYAASQGIPAVYFNTGSVAASSFLYQAFIHLAKVEFPYPEIYLHAYEVKELIAQGESIKVNDADEGFAYGIYKLSCDLVLIKTCKGIEGKYIDHLSGLCQRKMVPVGPLVKDTISMEENSNEIIEWLNKKNKHSTVYISFGSEIFLSRDQVEKITKGLEISNVDFIWVIRYPTREDICIENVLPDGFLHRVKDKGLVKGWTPQAKILAHQSIGGFVSHCGWGSVMESIYFGVPIIAMPKESDQPANARLVVELCCGVEVARDENGQFDGEDVAKAINQVIVEETAEGFRRKAKELSTKIKMEEVEAVDQAAEELRGLCRKKEIAPWGDSGSPS